MFWRIFWALMRVPNISWKSFCLHGERFITPFEITVSNVLSLYGISSEDTWFSSMLSIPHSDKFIRARSTISLVKSMPQTLPVSAAKRFATYRSNPAPLPISSTLFPGRIPPREKGLPTPQKDLNSDAGASRIKSGLYPRAFAPALPVGYLNFPLEEIATSAYFRWMASLIFCGSGEDKSPALSELMQSCWRPSVSLGGGQPFKPFFFFSKSSMEHLNV